MRRWSTKTARPAAWQTCRPRPSRTRAAIRQVHSSATCWARLERASASEDRPFARIFDSIRQSSIFDRIQFPERTADAWTTLLDGALPPHLRNQNVTPPALTLDAAEVAEILRAAQYPKDPQAEAFDLLYHLGFNQDRWSAVVWLIKKLVDKFPVRHGRNSKYTKVNELWTMEMSLHDATGTSTRSSPIWLQMPDVSGPSSHAMDYTLDELTSVQGSQLHVNVLGHEALGQVWRTLGSMTQACAGAGGEIRPEVLEIIAYLHHQEVMPMSIYQASVNPDRSTIQQPPLLPLLSSRILTSLSDAAWRAHQKLVVEEAKANGSSFSHLRPEITGSSYRVHVAGLRPEVWLELILWSCLHGGWIQQGLEILRSLVKSRQWKPLSWAQYERQLPDELSTTSKEWTAWEHLFRTRSTSSMDAPPESTQSIKQTISGELVNAYIDAVTTNAYLGGMIRMQIEDIVAVLAELKSFLLKNRQGLSFGTWESVVIRLLETNNIDPERDSDLLQSALSSSGGGGFGQSLYVNNTQDLPAYVLDGNVASLGLLHRALRAQIATGSLESALEIFHAIQRLTDADKRRSMVTFFGVRPGQITRTDITPRYREDSLFESLQNQALFTSNLSSIDYPSFNVKIPPNILGPFLELVCEAKALDFGRWLLYSDDMDGPVIPESLYSDKFMQPGIVRFAADTNDKTLLEKLQRMKLSEDSMRMILSIQIRSWRWSAAIQVLEHLAHTKGPRWHLKNLAELVRVSIILAKEAHSGKAERQQQLDRAKRLLVDLLKFRFGLPVATDGKGLERVQSVLTILAAVNKSWADFAYGLRPLEGHQNLRIPIAVFNIILDGVVQAYGSHAGRHLLGIFWPHSARTAFDAGIVFTRDKRFRKRIPRHRPDVLDRLARQRITVEIDQGSSKEMVAYGAIVPNATTILTILRKALEELGRLDSGKHHDEQQQSRTEALDGIKDHVEGDDESKVDFTPIGMVTWAVKRFAELPSAGPAVVDKLDAVLAEYGLEDLRKQLPEVYRMADEDSIIGSYETTDE